MWQREKNKKIKDKIKKNVRAEDVSTQELLRATGCPGVVGYARVPVLWHTRLPTVPVCLAGLPASARFPRRG